MIHISELIDHPAKLEAAARTEPKPIPHSRFYLLSVASWLSRKHGIGIEHTEVVEVPIRELKPYDERYPWDGERLTLVESKMQNVNPKGDSFGLEGREGEYYAKTNLKGTVLRLRVARLP